MTNKFLILVVFCFTISSRVCSQVIYYHKITDSVEITAIEDDRSVIRVIVNNKGKIDTMWHNDYGRVTVTSIEDIKIFKNKFTIIYTGGFIVGFVLWEWDGETWGKKGMAKVIARTHYKYPCHAEILNFDKVRVQQKGVSSIITYDTEKGIELSRTVEKE
jgi:hypothetical protein